jgi:hypothetical protein
LDRLKLGLETCGFVNSFKIIFKKLMEETFGLNTFYLKCIRWSLAQLKQSKTSLTLRKGPLSYLDMTS